MKKRHSQSKIASLIERLRADVRADTNNVILHDIRDRIFDTVWPESTENIIMVIDGGTSQWIHNSRRK